jgi:cyclopropane fatty-acyl-phospholipid synthase-like methyltransferase
MRGVHHKRTTCRACSGERLRAFLSLGPTPLANAFLRSPEEFAEEPSFPLDVYFCESCALVQLLDVIDPEVLFRDYIYVTGTSQTIAAHNAEYARAIVELLDLGAGDLVVEVASNDGSLLKCFQRHGVSTLGIEPAANIAALASAAGVETINRFFDSASAREVREARGPARAVIGNNVLAHVDETRDFLGGCRAILDGDGLVVIEVPYLRDLVEGLEYDTVYHEHLCYFSVSALLRLFEAVGLSLARVDHVPVHGGSLRVYAASRERHGDHAREARELAEAEREAGLTGFARFERFAADVDRSRRALVDLLESLHREGRTVAGYGAPAKGNTLLNFCGIDAGLLPYTVDKSPLKVGLYTPGAHIPVLPTPALLERQPDYALILAWNFAEEIVRQEQEYRDRGGRFIVPLPQPRIL